MLEHSTQVTPIQFPMWAPLILLQSVQPVTQLGFRLWPPAWVKGQELLHLSIGTCVLLT